MVPAGLTFLRTERISLRCGPDKAPAQIFPDRAAYLLKGKALAYPEFQTFVCDEFPMLRVYYPAAAAAYDRVDLVMLWHAMRALPDLRLVRCVIVVDFAHDEEAWLRRQSGQDTLTIRALTDTRGHIKLFRPSDERLLSEAIRHEWSHLLKFASPEEAGLFEALGDIEPLDPDVFLGDGQGSWTSIGDEIWATLGGTLLDGFARGEVAAAEAVSRAFPIRTALWGRAFARRRRGADAATALDGAYDALASWLRDQIEPEVVATLGELAVRSDLGRAARMLRVFERDTAGP